MNIDIGHDTYSSTLGKKLENELVECNNMCSCQCFVSVEHWTEVSIKSISATDYSRSKSI